VNQVNSHIPSAGVRPGQSVYLVDGKPAPVMVTPNRAQGATAVNIDGPDFSMTVAGKGADELPLGLSPSSAVIVQSRQIQAIRVKQLSPTTLPRVQQAASLVRCARGEPMIESSATGFKPNSAVKVYILPSVYVGGFTTDASGAYSGALPVPAGVSTGQQTLQANGFTSSGALRSLSLGILVRPADPVTMRTAEAEVLFETLSAQVTPQGRAVLNALVRKTRTHGMNTVVVGYVQPGGSSANDSDLSTMRAKSVALYLRKRGLAGAYEVRGQGLGGPDARGRRATVTVEYSSGCQAQPDRAALGR
jgi:outer membrane protein OmpA-like peptidoglycan-associated protein